MPIQLFEVVYADDIKTSSQFLLSGSVLERAPGIKKIAILFLRVFYTTNLNVKATYCSTKFILLLRFMMIMMVAERTTLLSSVLLNVSGVV